MEPRGARRTPTVVFGEGQRLYHGDGNAESDGRGERDQLARTIMRAELIELGHAEVLVKDLTANFVGNARLETEAASRT